MRNALRAALLAALLAPGAARAAGTPVPPPTRVEVVRDTLHGQVIEDPYRWLESRDSAETRQWVRDQMAFTMEQLGKVPGRDEVTAALARYSKLDTRGTPIVRRGRLFFSARRADQQQGVLAMRAGADAPDVVLVDPNPMSADHATSVSLLDVSIDGTLLAYGIRKGGEDEVEVHLLDVDTKQEIAGGLPKARYFGFSIDARRKGAWFGRWEPKGSRVWYHRFGDDAANSKLVFGDKGDKGDGLGPTEIPVPELSDNGKWLVLSVFVGSSGDNTHVFLRDAAREGAFTPVTDTLRAQVGVHFAGDQLLLETNWNAPNHRVMTVPAREPGLKNWKELVPERKDAVIEGVSAVAGRVVVGYLHNVSSELAVYGADGTKQATIALPGIGSASAPAGEWAGADGYYSFSSFNRPTTIYRYDFAGGQSREWWKSPAAFDPDRFLVRQVRTRSKDGTLVPMFVVQPREMAYDGSHPVLMTGYGGFNVSETPAWSARVAAWLDLGGIYVLTNLRGGSEFGEGWHRAGMLANKQHTFDDFIGCAQWLIAGGICTPSHLGIMGGSNGGLLVGAAMTQRPDLFGAVVCQVPLLDMLRYQQFLVARFWVPEYGSSEDSLQFRWLSAYSPYQHLVPGTKYPAVLFVSGDSDTRVDPLHARKMAARMQALGGERPVLLHYDVASGHAGGKSVDKSIEDTADDLQFLRWQLGMANPQ
jgi:prolyl oligopeptidase